MQGQEAAGMVLPPVAARSQQKIKIIIQKQNTSS
jgi:hypothetical protein